MWSREIFNRTLYAFLLPETFVSKNKFPLDLFIPKFSLAKQFFNFSNKFSLLVFVPCRWLLLPSLHRSSWPSTQRHYPNLSSQCQLVLRIWHRWRSAITMWTCPSRRILWTLRAPSKLLISTRRGALQNGWFLKINLIILKHQFWMNNWGFEPILEHNNKIMASWIQFPQIFDPKVSCKHPSGFSASLRNWEATNMWTFFF